jgi:serine/threonine-protein kinase HipA
MQHGHCQSVNPTSFQRRRGALFGTHNLKNFSVITRGSRTQLSPAYDLLNSTIVLPAAEDELALPLNGKKRNLRRKDLLDYFAFERLGLTPATVGRIMESIHTARGPWERWIEASFLPENLKSAYRRLVNERFERLTE